MKIFSYHWLKYNYLIHTDEYKKISESRKHGVDFSKFDLYRKSNKEFIFIHIPKAAGLSIVKALTGSENSHHAKASDYKKQDAILFESYFKFSLVREPISRCLSAYSYLKQGGRHNIYDYFWREKYIKKYKNFDSFVQEGGLKTAIENNAEHFIPQIEYICESDQCIVDLVGKFENIEEFVKNLSAVIGRNIVLEKINQTSYKNMRKMSKETTKIIEDLYCKDLNFFGY